MIFVQKAKASTKDCKKLLINTFSKGIVKRRRQSAKSKILPKATTSVKSVESILYLREFSNLERVPRKKRKIPPKTAKSFKPIPFLKGIVKRRIQSAKHKDSTKSYNKRKKRWINICLKGIFKLRMCPPRKAKDSTKNCKKTSNHKSIPFLKRKDSIKDCKKL